MIYEVLSKILMRAYYKFPFMRSFLSYIPTTYFFFNPRFSGIGMKSAQELPWNDEHQGEIFRQSCEDIKNHLKLSNGKSTISKEIDALMWRLWIISYATKHAIEFARGNNYNFVECGVANGLSTFIALREIAGNKKTINHFSMHLYDSWDAMKMEHLFKNESNCAGLHANLDIETTKKNLDEFKENVVYHKGYIPDTFYISDSLTDIIYLHIDLNSAKSTLETLYFFYPKITSGGVILFDDYGHKGFESTKKIIDKFFSDKPGIHLKFPTGQSIFFSNS